MTYIFHIKWCQYSAQKFIDATTEHITLLQCNLPHSLVTLWHQAIEELVEGRILKTSKGGWFLMNESKYKKGQSLRERKCHIVLM